MEGLEPWNMFTNDFVAEETDEILTDDILAEHRRSSKKAAQVKEEPMEEDSEEKQVKNNGRKEIERDTLQLPEDDLGEDDTIFNFNFDQADTEIKESGRRSIRDSNGNGSRNNNDDTPINFELAVVYICPACGKEFSAQQHWKRHMNEMHEYNTRRGLNFVQVDKLYHECQECRKRIAMHAMENLLKHKFTHLPYRCTKCKICQRHYKYRQDLMVHLRMTHRTKLQALSREAHSSADAEFQGKHIAPAANGSMAIRQPATPSLEIKDIKENAVDIFESHYDSVKVKNEVMSPDEEEVDGIADQNSNSFTLPAFLEDTVSHSSSDFQMASDSGTGSGYDEKLCEKYILYTCPQCRAEFESHASWRQHIESVHDYGTPKGLNFKDTNSNQHVQCLTCNKVFFVYFIHTLQLHKFTHLPNKSWLHCKLCLKSCNNHKDMVKHLLRQHHMENESAGPEESLDGREEEFNEFDDSSLTDLSIRSEERDLYEPHIDYMCPQCGKQFLDKKLWRKHIVKAHHLTDLQVLNFKVINERQVMCLECGKIITNAYGVQNAQQHRITHMPYKAFIRCRLCKKTYTDRKGLVKHLRSRHNIGKECSASHAITNTPTPTSQHMRPLPPLQPRPHVRRPPVREIVKHANVTYIINYLDEEDEDELIQDDAPVPELSFAHNFDLKCVDCGSCFMTQQELQEHIKKEHEFLDYDNSQPSPTEAVSNRSATSSHHSKNGSVTEVFQEAKKGDGDDADDDALLLIPNSEVEEEKEKEKGTSKSSTSNVTPSGSYERHFCYLCPACGREYRSQADWRHHLNTVHHFDKRHFLNFRALDHQRFQCNECRDIVFHPRLKGLQEHKFRHLPFRLYLKCLLCGTSYNRKPNMVNHLRVRHKISMDHQESSLSAVRASSRPMDSSTLGNTYKPSAFNKPPDLQTVGDCISYHNAVDHESIAYHCPQCNKKFETHAYWRKHIVEEHNLNNREGLNFRQIDIHHFICLQCFKRVTVTHTKGAIGQLQSHKFRHLPYRSFKCLRCNAKFVRKQMFFKHLNRSNNRCEITLNIPNNFNAASPNGMHSKQKSIDADEVEDEEDSYADNADINEDVAPTNEVEELTNSQKKSETGSFDCFSARRLDSEFAFALVCPPCGLQFDCQENMSGNKMCDLQTQRFKHLPHGAYLKCKFCPGVYQHVSNMKNHLLQRHPVGEQRNEDLQKMEEIRKLEEQEEEDEAENSASNAVDEMQHLLDQVEDVQMGASDDQFLLG